MDINLTELIPVDGLIITNNIFTDNVISYIAQNINIENKERFDKIEKRLDDIEKNSDSI